MDRVIHLPGLTHLPTNKTYSLSCAYSQKVLKLGTMLKKLGDTVYFYGIEGSEVECNESINVVPYTMWEKHLAVKDPTKYYKLDDSPVRKIFARNAIREILKRKSKDDFFFAPFGYGHQQIVENIGIPLTVESGVGYTETFAEYRVFESYTWMNYVYGVQKNTFGKNYDCVIYNYFDPNDFEFSATKKDYILYIGRIINNKGIKIIEEVAKYTGMPVKAAGQFLDEEKFEFDAGLVEYVGFADYQMRKELFRDARVVMVPTLYLPPFEGVHIESLFAGTPVITTDWGVFGETVLHGIVGYRCHTLDHFVWAVQNIDKINPYICREYAMKNFTLDVAAKLYDEYMNMLLDLVNEGGWYKIHPERTQMNWLEKDYGFAKYDELQNIPQNNEIIEPQNNEIIEPPQQLFGDTEEEFWSYYPLHLMEMDKQTFYAKHVGLFSWEEESPYIIDLQGKSVIEIGAGPNGLVLRCTNGRRKVIDPLDLPNWMKERYEYFGVEYEKIKAEDMNEDGWDEVWVFNVMQHVEDPELSIFNIKNCAKTIRIFDWLETPTDKMHPNSFTKQWYDDKLGGNGTVIQVDEPHLYKYPAYIGVFEL